MATHYSGEPFEPTGSEIEVRARQHVYKRYLQSTLHWRGRNATIFNVALFLLLGLIPAIPGRYSIVNVPLSASLLLFGIVALTTILAFISCEYLGPESAPYRLLTTLEAVAWCGANVSLIALSGTSSSIYWICLCGLVVVTATTVYRHTVLQAVLMSTLGLLLIFFLWQNAWSDALVSFAFGASLLWFQRLSTITGWHAEHERARAELISQHANRLLIEQERARIARDLHDGVAAELTSVLWQAQGLAPNSDTQIEELVSGVRSCIAEVRAAVNQARTHTQAASELICECERIVRTLVGKKATFTFDSILTPTDPSVTSELSNHVIRIIQECVRNALQHASPNSIYIQIKVESDNVECHNLSLSIQDDGVGLPIPMPNQRGGIANINERVRLLQGTATWRSSPSGGTELFVTLPVNTPSPPLLQLPYA